MKTEIVRARVTPAERLALVMMARREARRPSEMLREAIREAAARRNLWPPVGQEHSGGVCGDERQT